MVRPSLFPVLLLLLSNCQGGPSCDSMTCSGCCSADGVCQAGDTADACGQGGAACGACTIGQRCSDQRACVDPLACQPLTCASARATCGSVLDGCGGVLTCGTCGNGETCGGGG